MRAAAIHAQFPLKPDACQRTNWPEYIIIESSRDARVHYGAKRSDAVNCHEDRNVRERRGRESTTTQDVAEILKYCRREGELRLSSFGSARHLDGNNVRFRNAAEIIQREAASTDHSADGDRLCVQSARGIGYGQAALLD